MDENTLLIAEYVDQMAVILDLQLNSEDRTGVIEFATLKAIASMVNEFPLPDQIEVAPTFEP